jgi:hypothetical protein
MREQRCAAKALTVAMAVCVGLLTPAPVVMATYDSARSGSKIRPRGSASVRKTLREIVELEGQGHSPEIGVKWKYFVEATSRSSRPLAGKVLTEFLYDGTVIGYESPRYHTLRQGRLWDTLLFPPVSVGIRLTVQVVVTTRYGSVRLDWPVRSVNK